TAITKTEPNPRFFIGNKVAQHFAALNVDLRLLTSLIYLSRNSRAFLGSLSRGLGSISLPLLSVDRSLVLFGDLLCGISRNIYRALGQVHGSLREIGLSLRR